MITWSNNEDGTQREFSGPAIVCKKTQKSSHENTFGIRRKSQEVNTTA